MNMMRVVKGFLVEVNAWFEYLFIRNMPGRTGVLIRRYYWSKRLNTGPSLSISFGCAITSPNNISIGNDANIMNNCYLYAHGNGRLVLGDRISLNSNVQLGAADCGEIVLGNDVAIGPNVVIRASNHEYKQKNIRINQQGHRGGKIEIEDDVWIGANVTVLPNVQIGKGSVIAAGSVVNRNIPPYSLAGGVPARVLKDNCRI
jgi:galactoside O-acetyltransferase